MQINEQELQRRLNSSKNLANTIPVEKPESAKVIPIEKGERSKPLTEAQQITVGTLAFQMPVKDVAKEFGINPGQVSYAKNSKNPAIAGPIKATIERVQELALDKMMQALGLMTAEKFENASLKDLSLVAANMSKVIEKTTVREDQTNIQFVIYAPEMKSERSYRVLDV